MTGEPGAEELRHHLTTCRSCSAPVFWALPAPDRPGRMMLISAAPAEDGNILMTERPEGAPHHMRVLSRDEMPKHPIRYRSHFADCPHSQRWRTRK